jgi:hypothetical protein
MPTKLAMQRRIRRIDHDGAAVIVGPGCLAVVADVPLKPVSDSPRPFEQPCGQERDDEHGGQGG